MVVRAASVIIFCNNKVFILVKQLYFSSAQSLKQCDNFQKHLSLI